MHVGHLRSTVIGDALARMFESRGHTVIRQNHIGDWGTQFGMLTEHLIETKQESVDGSALNALYKEAKGRFDAEPDFKDRSRKRVVLLQGGDKQTNDLWQQLVSASRVYFQQIYKSLRITLTDEHVRGESSYNALLQGVVDELRGTGAVSVSEGATVAYIPGFFLRDGQPAPFIVQKADGGFGYAATDLCAIRHRTRDLKANRILYVVDSRQSDHFIQVFHLAASSKFSAGSSPMHVQFGTIMGEDKKPFKTREGGTIRLMDLIEEATRRALEEVKKRHPDMPSEEATAIAETIAIGALKYNDLRADRVKDYVFTYDSMLAMDGNTGPYLQYAYARICAISRKAAPEDLASGQPTDIAITHPAERALVLKVALYDKVVDQVLDSCHPHVLCTYLHELTQAFHNFYESCPVLKEGVDVASRKSRLMMCQLVAKVLKDGLENLGVDVLERM
mmetsp:Transcript_32385/g.76012  ORF Transcript_32385/g.76012 Transcript_32385/m.76012 type:complete len:449 (+) Transcript_32385:1-1347(+)